jgi:hypothetical protein
MMFDAVDIAFDIRLIGLVSSTAPPLLQHRSAGGKVSGPSPLKTF